MGGNLLDVRDLRLAFGDKADAVEILHGMSFSLKRGELAALVGESGCGKSLTALSLARLPPTGAARRFGEVLFRGKPLNAPDRAISYIFQDPVASLNPVLKIGRQICEGAGKNGKERAIRLLSSVGIPSAAMGMYPCQLSGGMCQRVMIAMALMNEPEMLVADEPTTALDASTQLEVMDLVVSLAKSRGMALLMTTHNLGLIPGRFDSLHVLYAGQVVESGPADAILASPIHPYTAGLIEAVPEISQGRGNRLRDIPGDVLSPREISLLAKKGPLPCLFANRCPCKTCDCMAGQRPVNIGGRTVLCRKAASAPYTHFRNSEAV